MKYPKEVYTTLLGELKRGKENSVKSDELAKAIGVTSRTNEFIREVIREMVEELGYCIGSCTEGFYIIDDEDDLKATANNLYSRAISMLNRKKILEKNFQHERNYVL
jgi:hypothetical protein